jgi:polysaccharide export outer membrane protein
MAEPYSRAAHLCPIHESHKPMNLKSAVKALRWIPLTVLLTTCGTVPADKRVIPSPATLFAPSTADINHALAIMATQTPTSSSDYRIGSEDLLQVTFFNVPETEHRIIPRTVSVRVSQQGMINLPLLREIAVKGVTVSALESTLRERYEKYMYSPQVSILVLEYRQRVSVIGSVQKPGIFDLTSPMSPLDLLTTAGGLNERAGTQVHIYRQGPEGRQTYIIDLLTVTGSNSATSSSNTESAALINMPLQGGDVINVPATGSFFLDGAVTKPGVYPLGYSYSLTKALASAGGLDREIADYSNVTIFRRRNTKQTEAIIIDLNSILAGNVADPVVETEDVIIVPVSATKYFVKRFVGQLVSGGISLGSFGAMAGS